MKLLKLHLGKKKLRENYIPIILTLFFGISFKAATAQNIDSLKSLMTGSKGGKLCRIYYQIAYEQVDLNSADALQYAEKSLQCASQTNDTLQIVMAVQLKAMAFRRL